MNYFNHIKESAFFQDGWDKQADYLRKYSDKKSLVLDAGSGWFRFAKIASEYNDQVFCVDITRPSSDSPSKCKFFQASIENLPFLENSFDFIYCISVLQYIRDEKVAMGEFYRVLKLGGKLLLTVPTALSPFRLIRDLEIRFGVYDRVYIPQFKVEVYHYYTKKRIKKLMKNRFKLVELVGDTYNFMPRLIRFIYYSIRLNKVFELLRFSYLVKAVKTRIGKKINDGRQVQNSEEKNQIIQPHEKEIVKQSNVAGRRACFISDLSYHYIIVLQKK